MRALTVFGVLMGYLIGLKVALTTQLIFIAAKCIYMASPEIAKKDFGRLLDYDIAFSMFSGLLIGNLVHYIFYFHDHVTLIEVLKWFITP